LIVTGILAVIIAYILGSIPFAFIISRLKKKVDIRQLGTGNVGTMNTVREIGFLPGIAVLLLDMAKGSLSILIAQWLGVSLPWLFGAGIASISGHSWPLFLKFSGGKGVATTLGVLLAVTPLEFGLIFIAILIIFLVTRNTGLSAGIGLTIFPFILWGLGRETVLIWYAFVIAGFLALRNLLEVKPDLKKMQSITKATFRINPIFWHKRK
jgi:acyl phosphate:glycerol-3-phosphate acyltransferase